MAIQPKMNKWDLIKLFHNKGNYQQGEKTAFRMGENNSKLLIAATPAAQFQKNK